MSLSETQRFYQKMMDDGDFSQKFSQTLFSNSEKNQLDNVTQLVKEQGFDIAPEELTLVISAFKHLKSSPNFFTQFKVPLVSLPPIASQYSPFVFPQETKLSNNRLDRLFIWLSGASPSILATCPESEQRKHTALGGAVLIPALLAIVTASFLLYTLNFNTYTIVPVALLWSALILLMDRAILATYRKSFSAWAKFGQFILRFGIALLIALTVAHPIVLLLFNERIDYAYNETRIKTERNNLALQCSLTNPQSELRLLDNKIADQRNELKNSDLLFDPAVCRDTAQPLDQEKAFNLENLSRELDALKAKQAQADQDVALFIANAEKEKIGEGGNGFTGVRGCKKGTQCKRWLNQASDRKDDSIKLGKDIVRLSEQINAFNEKITNQFIEGKQAISKQCEKEREELKDVRGKQNDLDQKSLVFLNDQRNLLGNLCIEKEAVIKHLKPDVLTQSELLTQLIFTKDGISWHNALIFLVFMLLFLSIDLLAVALKMTHVGLYESKVEMAERQNKLLEFIYQRHQVLAQFSELASKEQMIIDHLNVNQLKHELDENLKSIVKCFTQLSRKQLADFFKD